MLNAEILAIGSEMLTPFRIDTNSLWLTEQLNALGVEVKLKTIIGDDETRLEETIRDAMKRSEIVISTGGLGPTEDDVTKKVFARVLGRELEVHEPTLESIRTRFARRNMEMPANNIRQAMLMTGAELLMNHNGTAPGQLVQQGNCTVALLPGPPREMKPMFTDAVAPVLRQRVGELFILRRQLNVYGLSESKADELAAPLYLAYANPTTTILAKNGQIEFHLTAQARQEAEALALLDELAAKMKAALGDYVYAEGDATLEQTVGELLRQNGATLATAESCTGGLLAGRLTEVPGSSDYFIAGVVSYANAAKMDLLNVPRALIEQHGAVSEPVAEAMARGIRARAVTTYGIGITGIAGPGGGTAEKPVGLVYLALADAYECKVRKLMLPGDRQLIRTLAVNAALDSLRRKLKN